MVERDVGFPMRVVAYRRYLTVFLVVAVVLGAVSWPRPRTGLLALAGLDVVPQRVVRNSGMGPFPVLRPQSGIESAGLLHTEASADASRLRSDLIDVDRAFRTWMGAFAPEGDGSNEVVVAEGRRDRALRAEFDRVRQAFDARTQKPLWRTAFSAIP